MQKLIETLEQAGYRTESGQLLTNDRAWHEIVGVLVPGAIVHPDQTSPMTVGPEAFFSDKRVLVQEKRPERFTARAVDVLVQSSAPPWRRGDTEIPNTVAMGDGWRDWPGGEQPVSDLIMVEVKLRYGGVEGPRCAASWYWEWGDGDHPQEIVAWRLAR